MTGEKKIRSTRSRIRDHADHAGPSLPTEFTSLLNPSPEEDLLLTYPNRNLLTVQEDIKIKDAMEVGTSGLGTTLRT